MNPMSRRAVVSGALAALGASAAKSEAPQNAGCDEGFRTPSSQFVRLEPSRTLPELALQRLDGRSERFVEFRSRVVLFSFWATWCPPCRRELPKLERLHLMARDISVEVVAISIDRGGRKAVEPYLRELKVSKLPTFLDPEGVLAQAPGGTVVTPFILWGLPISFLVNRLATPVGYIAGEVDWTSSETLAFLASCANA